MAGGRKILIGNRQRSVRVFRERMERLVRFVARAEGRRIGAIDLAVVGADEMAGLNERFLRHAGPTDVLCFDLSEACATELSAQIIVCGEVAAREAARHGLTPQQELMLYVIHGLLHLTGHDDRTARQARAMQARQEELLERFGRKGK
ncbi:MAG: rRNA maturation RNase YbeY [Planctomycetota bacterium]|jgi:probable rRNA maturation factor